jgi:hypothetical protein
MSRSSFWRSRRGSFEVRFANGRPLIYFYWDDEPQPGRLRPEILTRSPALEQAKAVARAEQDGLDATFRQESQGQAKWSLELRADADECRSSGS